MDRRLRQRSRPTDSMSVTAAGDSASGTAATGQPLSNGSGSSAGPGPGSGFGKANVIPCGGEDIRLNTSGAENMLGMFESRLPGCVLADPMGLGKTNTICQLLLMLAALGKVGRRDPVLIVVPSKIRLQWLSELSRWAPSLCDAAVLLDVSRPGFVYEPWSCRSRSKAYIHLMAYEMFQDRRTFELVLRTYAFRLAVFDEARGFEDPSSVTRSHIETLRTHRLFVVAVTGTPLGPSLCNARNFLATLGASAEETVLSISAGLRPILVHRPVPHRWSVRRTLVHVPLLPPQRAQYLAVLRLAAVSSKPYSSYCSALMAASQLALPDDWSASVPLYVLTLQQMLERSAKLCVLHHRLALWLAAGQKVIVFVSSDFSRRLVSAYFQALSNGDDGCLPAHASLFAQRIPLIHGAMGSDASADDVRAFETSVGVILCTVLSGGRGTNLPSADHAVFFDHVRTARDFEQCEHRALRPPRMHTTPLHVTLFVAEDSVEEGKYNATWARGSIADALLFEAIGGSATCGQPAAAAPLDSRKARKVQFLEGSGNGVLWRSLGGQRPSDGSDLSARLPWLLPLLWAGRRRFAKAEWEGVTDGLQVGPRDFVLVDPAAFRSCTSHSKTLDEPTYFCPRRISAGGLASALTEMVVQSALKMVGGSAPTVSAGACPATTDEAWTPEAAKEAAYMALEHATSPSAVEARRAKAREQRADGKQAEEDAQLRTPTRLRPRSTAVPDDSLRDAPPGVLPLPQDWSSSLRGMFCRMTFDIGGGRYEYHFGRVDEVLTSIESVGVSFPLERLTGRPNPWVTIKIDCINHHDVFLVPESAAAAAWGWLQPCASAVTARAAVRAARGVHLPSRSALPAGWNPTNGLLQFEVAGRDYCIGKFAEVERARQAVALLDQVRPLVAHSPDCRPDDWAAKHELLTAAVGRAVAMGDNFRCSSVTCDGFADSNGGATATATTRRRQGVGDGASDANAATTTAAAAAAEAAAADDDDDDNDDDDNGDGGGDDDEDEDYSISSDDDVQHFASFDRGEVGESGASEELEDGAWGHWDQAVLAEANRENHLRMQRQLDRVRRSGNGSLSAAVSGFEYDLTFTKDDAEVVRRNLTREQLRQASPVVVGRRALKRAMRTGGHKSADTALAVRHIPRGLSLAGVDELHQSLRCVSPDLHVLSVCNPADDVQTLFLRFLPCVPARDSAPPASFRDLPAAVMDAFADGALHFRRLAYGLDQAGLMQASRQTKQAFAGYSANCFTAHALKSQAFGVDYRGDGCYLGDVHHSTTRVKKLVHADYIRGDGPDGKAALRFGDLVCPVTLPTLKHDEKRVDRGPHAGWAHHRPWYRMCARAPRLHARVTLRRIATTHFSDQHSTHPHATPSHPHSEGAW